MILLYDDAIARTFEPFATSRPLGEVRAGALLIRRRWEHLLQARSWAFVSSSHLDGFHEFDSPPFLNDAPSGDVWLVNTRAIPFLQEIPAAARILMLSGRVAAMRVSASPDTASMHALVDASFALEADQMMSQANSASVHTIDGIWLDGVWDLVGSLPALLDRDIPALATHLGLTPWHPEPGGAVILGPHPVFIEPGATIEPYAVLDTTTGPILVQSGSRVQAFTRLTGPCFIGRHCLITTDRIAGCAIGEHCRIHGELTASIVIGHANKSHDGFVGHSVLGRWVNLGASTVTSNLKNTYGPVSLWTPHGVVTTPLQFLGALFGDHAKTGIGLRITTGAVIGCGANVTGTQAPKLVPPFAWGANVPYESFEVEKFIQTTSRVMARRDCVLSDPERDWWRQVHSMVQRDMRWQQ
jgi:UDP-N-acetylglucosamine diphosphorylase/glucosamine-1-phosphate N-acetyltransferase